MLCLCEEDKLYCRWAAGCLGIRKVQWNERFVQKDNISGEFICLSFLPKKESEAIFRMFEELYQSLALIELASVVGSTGCEIPCHYNQYKFLNIDMKADEAGLPEGQVQYGLWAVTKFTRIEQEILLYPFTSLLAEFGGALGLFLGFSIMTIWDGVEGILRQLSVPWKNLVENAKTERRCC